MLEDLQGMTTRSKACTLSELFEFGFKGIVVRNQIIVEDTGSNRYGGCNSLKIVFLLYSCHK